MIQNIIISKKEMELINDLLNLDGDEVYQKYGFKRDETITHTAKFPNGIEADIKLVICEEERPCSDRYGLRLCICSTGCYGCKP